MYQLKARCSGLADLMVKPKSGNGISATAKSAVGFCCVLEVDFDCFWIKVSQVF